MECDLYRSKIEAYVDAELAEQDDRATFNHLSSCEDCGREALSLLQTKRLVKTAAKRYTPSPEFKRKVLGTKRKESRRPWYLGVVVATAVLVAVVASGLWLLRRSDQPTQIADLHVTMLASATPYDVVSSDKHTVKPWFQGRLPFAFNLPDLPDATFTLAGARLVYLEGKPAAELVYMYGQHRISVFVSQATGRPSGKENRRGFTMLSWTRDGLAYTAISDASADAVERLVKMFQQ